MKWVVDNIYEVEADLLRFYGMTLDEATTQFTGRTFFELVARLGYYGGAVSSLTEDETPQDDREEIPLGHDSLNGLFD